MSMSACSLHQICLTFDGNPILHDVDMELASGTRACLSGPSGAGKTSLLRILAGLEIPEKGIVEISGKTASRNNKLLIPPWQRGIGMVFQDIGLWPARTVSQHVTDPLKTHGASQAEAKDAAEVILKSLGLENLSERLPNNLSGGEARRLGLARAIAPRPPLLLLDEPFAGLDPDSRRESIAYIEQVINETRTTVLLVTHRTEEAAMLGGPMYSLEGGALSS